MIKDLLSKYQFYLIGVLLVLLVGVGVALKMEVLSKAVVQDKVTAEAGTIARQDVAEKEQTTAAEITDKSQVQTTEAEDKLVDDQTAADTEVTKHVEAIKLQYSLQPPTALTYKNRDDAISSARLDGLLSAYCESPGVQDPSRCPK